MPAFSDALALIWNIAAAEAGATGHFTIKPAHFFIALAKVCDLPLRKALHGADAEIQRMLPAIETEISEVRGLLVAHGLAVTPFRRRLRGLLDHEGRPQGGGTIHRDPAARRLCERAEALCRQAGDSSVRPLHLLHALCELDDAPWRPLFDDVGIDRGALLAVIAPTGMRINRGTVGAEVPEKDRKATPTPLLDQFGRDLTALARERRLSPVIGREEEMRRLGQVLLQQRRSNVILVGDAGVGKTCVVEGFSQRITGEDVAEAFRGLRVVELPISAIVAGTKYRGEFEERLQGILEEASRHPGLVLFMDEIHLLMGTGSSGGSMDAANLLKPALARGDIRCIGATTTAEYRRHIEKDAALQRRFQTLWIEEPTREEALAILRGLRAALSEHHGLPVEDDALTAAVDLSIRYAPDQRLPDKAIDLIDETCARARLQSFSHAATPAAITRSDLVTVVAERYRVPIEQLTEDDTTRLLRLEEALRRRVKGQEEAIGEVARAVRKARVGLKKPNRPQGVFLFVGPTGTGKTELAKALAECLFGSEDRLIRIDMSEYQEPHTVARLIGSPPGYVGHEEEGQLTAAIRTYPYAVVLLDEIEKAHPEVLQLFLQVFDDGRLTDTHGRTASFKEAIIIMTSNLGSTDPDKHGLGFLAEAGATGDQAKFQRAVHAALRPELINRIHDGIVCFNRLDEATVREIVEKLLDGLRALPALAEVTLTLDESAYALLMAEGTSAAFGAREMERAIDRLITEPLSTLLLEQQRPGPLHLIVRAEDGAMRFIAEEVAPV